MIKIVDNFLPPSYYHGLSQLMMNDKFPWYVVNGVSEHGDGDYFFTHNVYRETQGGINSDFWNEFKPMLFLIEEKLNFQMTKLLRIKCNLYTNQNKEYAHKDHVDWEIPHYTALYYVNSNNGPTTIAGQNIESVGNRMVFFDGSLMHHSNLQTDEFTRVNVNINLEGYFRE